MLRQAPNVILVGEMRDLETAMGIQAPTGHRSLVRSIRTRPVRYYATRRHGSSGLHGRETTVIGIMAQRLVRCVCPKCKRPTPSEAELREARITPEMAAKATFMKGKGASTAINRISRSTRYI